MDRLVTEILTLLRSQQMFGIDPSRTVAQLITAENKGEPLVPFPPRWVRFEWPPSGKIEFHYSD